MSIRKGLAVIVVAFSATIATVSKAETLADVLTYTYDHSGLLEQNRALLRAADEDVAQAVSSTLPVINWAASSTWNSVQSDLISSNVQISAELTLYDGGIGQLAVDAQKELVLGTRESLRNVEQQILLRAIEAYVEVRRNAEFVALRQSNVRVITQEFRAAQDRFDVGEVTRTDVSLAEARLAAARSLLASAQGGLARANEEFRAAVGRAPGNLRAVSAARVNRGLADAKAYAVRYHPSMLETQHSVAAAELNILRAQRQLGPKVSLSGQIGADQDGNAATQIGVNASGPIYQGGRLSSVVRQFMSRRDAARAGLHITSLAIEQNVGNAYSFLEVARASRQASNQQIRAADVAFSGVREEATLGARTTLDVLNAEQELLDARANLISAQSDEVVASYSLLATMGLLTAAHLNLPVQQYDPAAYYNLVKDAPTARSEQGAALDRVLQALGK